jgi:hypothetical protein
LKWSSIENALARIGAPLNLRAFVMNSLKGTTLCMKTNIAGRVTPTVQLHKAIKQGCPLAPLLFTIVMDELHTECRKIGGYSVNSKTKVSTRGYCDDTVILADNMDTLKELNTCVAQFFQKHSLNLNVGKTYLLGRNSDGSCNTEEVMWPGREVPIEPRGLDYSVRYLGAHINMNLDWSTQISKMNSTVMNLVSHMSHRKVTLLQGAVLVRYTLSQRLGIGLRHADIPEKTLIEWSKWIARAVTKRTELPLGSIHFTSIFTIMGILTLERQYILDKTIHIARRSQRAARWARYTRV